MGNLLSHLEVDRSTRFKGMSMRVSENSPKATHTTELNVLDSAAVSLEPYDILNSKSLSALHEIMRIKASEGLWLVISERGSIKFKIERFYFSAEFVSTDDIGYAVSHRWCEDVIKVNNEDFAIDWVGLIPDGRAWIDCVTHMNDPYLVKRTLECMGGVYVCRRVHAIYCMGGNDDVVECVFRGWMFQELSYVKITDAVEIWNDRGLGAWSLKMVGCLDQYDMHDLLVMTKSTSSPNSLAEAVGSSIKLFYRGVGDKISEFRDWIQTLPDDATSINLEEFKKHLTSTSVEPLSSIGSGARLTEYMGIKLVSLYKPFLEKSSLMPVENGRYIDTLLNNLNMALYSKENDALVATISAYEVYLKKMNDFKLTVKCAMFIEEEEYFIIEPKRHETTMLLLESLNLLVSASKFEYEKGIRNATEDGVISWLSTKDQITIYYAGNRLSSWRRIGEGIEWADLPGAKL